MAGGVFTGTGAWENTSNWDSGLIPTDTDEAIIPKALGNDVTDGTGVAAVDLSLLYIHRFFSKSFGTQSSPIKTAAVLAKIFSGGPVYIDVHTSASSADINDLRIAMANSTLVCQIGGASGNEGEIDRARIQRGRVTFKGSALFEASAIVEVGFVSNQRDDCNVLFDSECDDLPTLKTYGGRVTAHNLIATAYIDNTFHIQKSKAITNCFIGAGSTVEWEHESVAGDNTVIHVAAGGLLDLLTTGLKKDMDDVFVWPGGEIRFDPSLHTFSGANGLVDMRDGVLI